MIREIKKQDNFLKLSHSKYIFDSLSNITIHNGLSNITIHNSIYST